MVTSLAKLVAAGADYRRAYLTLQEFFEKLREDPARWGKPFAALLGALDAQLDFGAAAIGGKDSMSGTFNDLDVPPTLISFAIAPIQAGEVLSPEFKEAGHPVYLFAPANGGAQSQREAWETFHQLCRNFDILGRLDGMRDQLQKKLHSLLTDRSLILVKMGKLRSAKKR